MADDSGRINQLLSETTFLYGGNAGFVEDLYAKYAGNPSSVPEDWRAYFDAFGEQPASIVNAEKEPSWARAAAPMARPDWMSAIDGVWPAVEAKIGKAVAAKAQAAGAPASVAEIRAATLDSVRAIMMIRAFRIRGHLAANLDPLGIDPKIDTKGELDARHLRFRGKRLRPPDLPRLRAGPGDRDRPRDPGDREAHLLRHGGRAVHAHLQPHREGVDPGAHRGQGQGDHLHPRRARWRS